MEGIPSFVCKNAVIKPEQTPASIAAKRAKTGCPVSVIMAQTAHPKVKQPSVDKSAMFKIENEINSARATRA